MKVHVKFYIVLIQLILALNVLWAEQSNIEQFSYLTQDSISLVEDRLTWNDSPTPLNELQRLIPSSYSLDIGVYNPDSKQLQGILQLVKTSGIADGLITLNLYGIIDAKDEDDSETKGVDDLFSPVSVKEESAPEPMTPLLLKDDGTLWLSDEQIELADLSARLSGAEAVSFYCIGSSQFSRIYEVLQVLTQTSAPQIRLTVERRRQVKIEAKLVELLDDGTEKKLSSPSITTKPGNMAALGVRDTQKEVGVDMYQQNGRSGGGTSFRVLPQVIGDYIKVTGSLSVKRIQGADGFTVNEQSIHSYSTETIVIPFAYIFDDVTDSIEFDSFVIGDKKYICRLKATHVSDKGKRIHSTGQPF